MTPSELVIVVPLYTAAIVSVIQAIASAFGRRRARSAAKRTVDKLDEIHDFTNSNLTRVTAQLAAATERIAELEKLLRIVTRRELHDRPDGVTRSDDAPLGTG